MKRIAHNTINLTDEQIHEEARKYSTIMEWRRSHITSYIKAKRTGRFEEFITHMSVKNKFTREDIVKLFGVYKDKATWIRKDRFSYAKMQELKFEDKLIESLYLKLIDDRGNDKMFTDEELIKQGSKFKTNIEWQKEDKVSYRAASRRLDLKIVFPDMAFPRDQSNREDLLLKKYSTLESIESHLVSTADYLFMKEDKRKSKFQFIIDKIRYKRESKKEIDILEYIRGLNFTANRSYFTKDGSRKGGYEADIFIPDKGIIIEYDGLAWHSDYKPVDNKRNISKKYHLQKRLFFNNLGYQCLFIREDEWKFKQDIVKSVIANKLGKSEFNVDARKCIIKNVDNVEAQAFLSTNHLMGEFKTAKYIGLYNNNELVSLIGYKKYKDGVDISRFCNRLNTNVRGGLSKLLSYVENLKLGNFIQYYIDLRYGTGSGIEKLGYKLENITLGWRWTDLKQTYNRLKCRANMDSRNLTENQHAQELNLHKIYDAGQAKYIKKLPDLSQSQSQ